MNSSSPRDLEHTRLFRQRGGYGEPEYRPRPWPAISMGTKNMKSQALQNAEAAIDAACQAVDAATCGLGDSGDLIRAKTRALLQGYDRKWRDSPYEPIEVEKTYTAPLINPDTNKPSRTFQLAGKIDLLARYHGRLCVIDHKTTSDDITSPDSPFWRQLVIEAQPSHYMLLLWLCGLKCDDAVWDVIRKPKTSPKKLTKTEVKTIGATKNYYGVPLSDESLIEAVSTEHETVEMYEARLVRDCTVDRPEWFFQRRSVPRLDSELLTYSKELWDVAQEIITTRNAKRYIKTSGACMAWGSPCRYLGLCSGYDRPDSDKWVKKVNVHTELPTLDGDGRGILTNSQIKTYLQCRMKHHLAYELGIERVDEEEKETLFFGNVIHAGLEAWWNTLIPAADLEPTHGVPL